MWLWVISLLIAITYIVKGEVHGGTMLALAGKECVAVACDSRFASHRTGGMAITSSSRVVHHVGSQCIMGCLGLDSDSRILVDSMRERLASHEDLELEPHSIARCVSNILYEKGLYLTPLITGLDNKGLPYICSMDGLGSTVVTRDFAASGTASGTLFAICEAHYESDLEQEELVALAKRCFGLAMQRDVMSGGECKVFLLSQRGVETSAFLTDDSW